MSSKTLSYLGIAAAFTSALATASILTVASANAADGVKCYGISKAGENDCANAAGTHSCAGQSKDTFSGADWKAVESADACTAMDGATEPFEGANPKKS